MNKIRVIFYGTPLYAVESLERLVVHKNCDLVCVVTQSDKPAHRGQKTVASPVKIVAEKYGIPVLTPLNIKQEAENFKGELARFAPIDLAVTIAFGQIIPEMILAYPKYRSLNLHASLLPRWRGATPIQRAIMAGDAGSGVCLMGMTAGLDEGPVYAEIRTVISPSDTYGTLSERLSKLSAELIYDNLEPYINGLLTPKPQPEVGITYAKKISNQEAAIVWSNSGEQIARQIRGLSPAPGAYTMLSGKRLKILAAESCGQFSASSPLPGTVTNIDSSGIEVAAGGGTALRLTVVQLEGRRGMSAADFARGTAVSEGCVLG